MSSRINKKKISLHHCFCLPTLSLYAGCWVDEWGVAAWLLHRMLPPWSFSAWHTKPTRRGKHWRETPEQEASLPPGVVLEGKLCTVYLDIYLKTNLLFWDCSLSLLLSVFPLFLSLLPVCVCVCVCVCAHAHECVHTRILGISHLKFSWWANPSQFPLVTCNSFLAPVSFCWSSVFPGRPLGWL